MHPLAMPTGTVTPFGHGPLIQAIGVDNRLNRTAIGKQADHDHHQFDGFAQACEYSTLPCTKHFAAGATAVARSLSTMDHDIALSDLPPCTTGQIRAELLGDVHLFCICFHTYRIADGRSFFKLLGLLSPVNGVVPVGST